ncbi:cyclic nucleotide-binding domain-containing protein [Roseomonas sp. M0104]|uniref:Cyclic nucleotide-binding domain-containing protein n=1 Tax=Teichococcus coralli TaxID=2545983 RepID=A0A845BCT9_9PROT|nr:helix-turn-helix domain-containing protein [Pseudoroseomonas coralli]MXP63157.1 cyclic nucleotide-binding domain-containing protein [Pseudoroseomonas coralli]
MPIASLVRGSSAPAPPTSAMEMLGMGEAHDPRFAFGHPLRLGRGAEIYAEGAPIGDLYKVVSGTVRTCRYLQDGRRVVAEFVLAGEIFGVDGVDHHNFSAEAVTEAVVIAFPREQLNAWVDHELPAARAWRNFMLAKLSGAQSHCVLLGRKTATERVASLLLDLADRAGSASLLDLPMSRYDIADHLGLTAETVSRIFSGFRRGGVIANRNSRKVRILDRSRLEAEAARDTA